jgi:hypothetical protein
MHGHGSQTREEWKIVFKTTLGTHLTEWRSTEDSADALVATYAARGIEVVTGPELATRILDF